MPELPEVETMRRGVLGVVGARVERIAQLACPRKPIAFTPEPRQFQDRTAGRNVTGVDRIGKRVLVRLDTGDAIVFEPRMTGLVLVKDSPDPLYLRVHVGLKGGAEPDLWFWDRRGLGNVRLLSEAEQGVAFGPDKLGPDGLVVSSGDLRRRLASSRREVKVALLDQKAVAGIGNIYAAEALHVAGVHPAARCDRLSGRQWEAIVDAIHEVLEEAIRCEGSTLSDGTYRNALNADGGYQNQHRVYDKAGDPCRRCGATILRIVQAQRSTFFCPGCQTRRRK
ncbi:Formamidopyrimidine-DNA glycosylase [Pirellulimonas nuda]|uniref:Formamidopyrimidine-DNA glycosylase n=1 Tax=Pirellulimonas nuda TaxID=2528009 RepID=A0A518DA03_9BACT|nr:bifunctional DNA-formamidopyrimidine glycosylase/DNA-(apurinic or apyrimidinic site) lyase [Pirellulimonas nuda]QDU88317.1 Formamidopyrimidine-DNA glycosylase [Pirellulimonas nuda]